MKIELGKKRKAKGPNPLSVKKKKLEKGEFDGTRANNEVVDGAGNSEGRAEGKRLRRKKKAKSEIVV